MTNQITVDMLDAIKVQFLKSIFEEDFVERGMKAWLVGIEWEQKTDCYKLYFNFADFEEENDKYFKETYYKNIHTSGLPVKQFYTAKEAGMYQPRYSVLFSCGDQTNRDDAAFAREITKYLKAL